MKIRPQYHFRQTEDGLLAWDVRRLIELSKNLSVKMVIANDFAELDADHWYFHGNASPTCRSIIEHRLLMDACDLSYPIILDQEGRVMDGMHRICKAVINRVEQIPAVQFSEDPEPDYINCDPEKLPYADAQRAIEEISMWARDESGVCGLAIVGSYARGAATPDSDLDVVVLCDEPEDLLSDQSWLENFGLCESIEIETYGIVTSIFAYYDWGLEIEFGITPRIWTHIPIDEGTAQVIADGIHIRYGPEELLAKAAHAVTGR